MRTDEVGEVLSKTLSQELLKRDVARLACVATGGTPRVIPIGIFWNGSEVVMCTTKNARKLKTLQRNPAVALTIDTEVHPPDVLLLRGTPSSTRWTASRARLIDFETTLPAAVQQLADRREARRDA